MTERSHSEIGLQRGHRLRPGDLIGIVAPAGPVKPEALEEGMTLLRSWGYRTLLGDAALARHGYLAGADRERAADLNAMWAHPEVAGILCARGGYGSMRILDHLDWTLIRERPRFFCGFSDITALHLALEQQAGLITFHGPMAAAFGAATAYNAAGLRAAMESTAPLGFIPWPQPEEGAPAPVTVRPGTARGRLIGGNLMLICSLLGTPYEPDLTGSIVVLEEVDEEPYRVDRLLTQLLLGRKLQRAAGILFGDSPSCMRPADGRPSPTLLELLQELLAPLGIPVLYGFPCGHSDYRATLPLGAAAVLDATAGSLTILEAALV